MKKFKVNGLMLLLVLLWGVCNSEELSLKNPLSANAGDDQISSVNAIIILDGSKSTNSRNQTIYYAWEVIEQPDESYFSIETPNHVESEFVGSAPGEYLVLLTILYSDWLDTDTVSITLTENQ